ncbi:MAG: YbbR-like domain-containing protein [Bacteroidales bacterium]|nr:YbbR-like domain-containing protein [Bacteroidales bacterium]
MVGEKKSAIKTRLGREWMILLFALVLSFSIWFLYNMSGNYHVQLKFPLSAATDIPGHAGVAVSKDPLSLKCRGTGFSIVAIRRQIAAEGSLKVNVQGDKFSAYAKGGKDAFRLEIQDILLELGEALGSSISIESVETPVAVFTLPAREYKTVPVVMESEISFREQYMAAGDFILSPDSVSVYGPKEHLSSVKYVSTEKLTAGNVSETLKGEVNLRVPKDFELSCGKVSYEREVVRFVEFSQEVEFSVKGAPRNVRLVVIPATGVVRYRLPLNAADAPEPLSFVISYDEYAKSRAGGVTPVLQNPPLGMISYELDPPVVECAVAL